MDGFVPCETLDQQQICTGILRRRCRLRATAHFLLALPKAAMQCIAAIWRWQNACGRARWVRSDIRITKKKPSEWMVLCHVKLWINSRSVREYSGGAAAFVPRRIFFWLCQKPRCSASRPSGDGKMLVVEPDGFAPTYGSPKKKPSEWMVSFLVTRTGIEPMLPP